MEFIIGFQRFIYNLNDTRMRTQVKWVSCLEKMYKRILQYQELLNRQHESV